MIIGYISGIKYAGVELRLRRANPTGKAFQFSIGERSGFFFHSVPNKFNKLAYCDENRLVLCDGVPIRRSGGAHYEVMDTLNKQDVDKGIGYLWKTIVSNVSIVYFKAYENDAEVILSSSRASAGKMYYRLLKDGIAFSSDFVQLFGFGESNLNDEGIYAILRYGACPAPLTISRDIHAVPPSHHAVFDLYGNHLETQVYFQFDFSEINGCDLKAVSDLLDSSTHILDELGASILISGGVDSTILADRISQHSDRKVRGYYLAFGNKDPELPYAREAAYRTGCHLEVFGMHSGVVADTIIELAHAYTHPFNDYSVIPTYYLMKCIASCEDETLIIDGTGADECLGVIDPALLWKLKLAFAAPKFVKLAILNVYAHSDLLGPMNRLTRIPRKMADCSAKDINLVCLPSCPWTTLFRSNTRKYEDEIQEILTSLHGRMLSSSPHNTPYYAAETVAKICQTSCGVCSAKTHNIRTTPTLQAVYPFMWRDMLQEQGKLSWSAKNNKGVIKWPLKELLKGKFPKGFTYRTKSGFTPPFESWFSDGRLYSLLYDTLSRQSTVTESVVDRVKLKRILQKLPGSTNWPGMLCNLLWGILFTELWIGANTHHSNDK